MLHMVINRTFLPFLLIHYILKGGNFSFFFHTLLITLPTYRTIYPTYL
jgi:hypothetical protein